MDSRFSRAPLLDWLDSLLFGEKFSFGKNWSRHLFYFILKEKIKQERKPERNDSIVLEKRVFDKPESRLGDQVTYWEGTSKR